MEQTKIEQKIVDLSEDDARRMLKHIATFEPELIAYMLDCIRADTATDVQSQRPAQADNDQTSQDTILSQVWGIFRAPAVQKEIALLTTDERTHIDRMTRSIVEKSEVFQIAMGNPLGVPDSSMQFIEYTILNKPDRDFQWLAEEISRKLPTYLKAVSCLSKVPAHYNIVQVFPDPTNKANIVVVCFFRATPGTALNDKRGMMNEFVLVLPRKDFLPVQPHGDYALPLLPFALRNAAALLDPQSRIFFEASLQGGDAILDSEECPVTLLDYEMLRVVTFDDTRKSARQHASTDNAYDSSVTFRSAVEPTNIFVPPERALNGGIFLGRNRPVAISELG